MHLVLEMLMRYCTACILCLHAGRWNVGSCRPVSRVAFLPGVSITAFAVRIDSTYLAALSSSTEWADATALHALSISQSATGPILCYDSVSGAQERPLLVPALSHSCLGRLSR